MHRARDAENSKHKTTSRHIIIVSLLTQIKGNPQSRRKQMVRHRQKGT